ncbi:hypothetical protein VTJ49DRAFT_591 [Mycothermus thermophilus]|uniref:Uncharacterized protein n=1 Tax=Humicola insolens TaxID=85995 RepID=A0ABR3VFL1_HUMIN
MPILASAAARQRLPQACLSPVQRILLTTTTSLTNRRPSQHLIISAGAAAFSSSTPPPTRTLKVTTATTTRPTAAAAALTAAFSLTRATATGTTNVSTCTTTTTANLFLNSVHTCRAMSTSTRSSVENTAVPSDPAPGASTSPLPGTASSPQGGAAPAGASAAHAHPHAATVQAEDEQPRQHQQQQPSPSPGDEPQQPEAAGEPGKKPLPLLPAPTEADHEELSKGNGLRTVVVNGQAVALDNLGPMVVGRDGTVSRIANWHEMTEIERQNTLRVLCKRNQLRLANLRAGRDADAKPESSSAA